MIKNNKTIPYKLDSCLFTQNVIVNTSSFSNQSNILFVMGRRRQNRVLIYMVFASDLYTEIISITTLPILKNAFPE